MTSIAWRFFLPAVDLQERIAQQTCAPSSPAQTLAPAFSESMSKHTFNLVLIQWLGNYPKTKKRRLSQSQFTTWKEASKCLTPLQSLLAFSGRSAASGPLVRGNSPRNALHDTRPLSNCQVNAAWRPAANSISSTKEPTKN